jgi:hypothetical protein
MDPYRWAGADGRDDEDTPPRDALNLIAGHRGEAIQTTWLPQQAIPRSAARSPRTARD